MFREVHGQKVRLAFLIMLCLQVMGSKKALAMLLPELSGFCMGTAPVNSWSTTCSVLHVSLK